MFIVIDGIDASWKKTQVDLLEKNLISAWKTVYILDFPRYDSSASFFVQKYLSGWYGKNLSAEMSSLFFALDRFDASFDFSEKLEQHDYVIANRYVSASMIHHGCKIEDTDQRKEFLDWLEKLEYDICKIPKPDKTFFLSFSFENNLQLLHKRHFDSGTTELDLHEGDNEYLYKAWKNAHEICDMYGWEKIVCDDEKQIFSRETIAQSILEKVL